MRKKHFNLIELIVCLVLIALLAVVSLYWMEHQKAKELAKRISCRSSLKGLGFALKHYAMDGDDVFPNLSDDGGWDFLRENQYCTDYRIYACPSTNDTGKGKGGKIASSYIYRGGLTESDSVDSALAWDKANNHSDYGSILFLDGRVTGYEGINWLKNAK